MPEPMNPYPNLNSMNARQPDINRMAAVSQFLGILSILSIGFFFFPELISAIPLGLVCSNMGILFAHLSKGSENRYPSQAMVGLGTSVFSLVIYILLILLSILGLYMAIRMFGPQTALDPEALQNAINDFMNQYLNSLTTGGGTL